MSIDNLQHPSFYTGPFLRDTWLTNLFTGIVMIVLGTLAIALPMAAAMTVEILLGILLLAGGVMQLIAACSKESTNRFFTFISAALFGIVGGLLLARPWSGILTMTLLLSVFFAVEGIAKIISAFKMRPAKSWGWMAVSGLVTLALGGIIWAAWPGDAIWVIGLIVGIDLLFGGLATIMISLIMREMLSTPKSPSGSEPSQGEPSQGAPSAG